MHSFKTKLFITIVIAVFSSVFAMAVPPNDNFNNAETVSGIRLSVVRNNVGATKETGEPNHASDPGGKSVWFRWTAPFSRDVRVSTTRSVANMRTLIAIYTGTSIENLESQISTSDTDSVNHRSNIEFSAVQGTTYMIVVDGATTTGEAAEGEFRLDLMPVFRTYGADYDNDGLANFAVWRQSTGTFFHYKNWTGQTIYTQWGTSGDIPVVGGERDVNYFMTFRPAEGVFYGKLSECCGADVLLPWGIAGDVPFFDNFLGDTSTPAVYRPSEGRWYIYSPSAAPTYYRFGATGDIPVPAHYSANAMIDLAVFRPADGTWHILERSNNDGFLDRYSVVKFGVAGDIPAPGDYDGDGVFDIAVFRPSSGTFWVRSSANGSVSAVKWGLAGDIPQTGDFDGDGIFDYAVYRPSNNVWYIRNSADGSFTIKEFGLPGDIPVTSYQPQM